MMLMMLMMFTKYDDRGGFGLERALPRRLLDLCFRPTDANGETKVDHVPAAIMAMTKAGGWGESDE